MSLIQYNGTVSFNEASITGVSSLWQPGQISDINDNNRLSLLLNTNLFDNAYKYGYIDPSTSDSIDGITKKRPKMVTIGNSINARNIFGEITAGYWSAWGVANWVHALSGCGFDRCASTPFIANGQMDAYGNFAWSSQTATTLANETNTILKNLLEKPDIIWISSLFENTDTSATAAINAATSMINAIKLRFPACKIILSAPGPSYSNSINPASVTQLNTVRSFVLSNILNVLVDDNLSLFLGDPSLYVPNTYFFSDNWNIPGTVNVHQNEAGAIKRAKSFIKKFGYLFGDPITLPSSSYLSANGVLSKNLNKNPDLSLVNDGVNGETMAGGGNVTNANYMWWRNSAGTMSTSNMIVSGNASENGLRVTLSSTNTLPGTSSGSGSGGTVYLNECNGTSNALAQALNTIAIPSDFLSDTFRCYSRVTVISTKNLNAVGCGRMANISNNGATPVNIGGFQWQNAFAASIENVLSEGDVITIESAPFNLGASIRIDDQSLGFRMMPVTGAQLGPTIEFNNMCFLSLN